jgi:polysaccharide pyruvyl transferase WcaK-like protein
LLVEIKGVQFENKGAALMMHAVLQQMAQRLPGAEPVLVPDRHASWRERTRIGAWQKLNPRKRSLDFTRMLSSSPMRSLRLKLREFGVVTDCDVDLVLDASGFAYGDTWPDWTSLHMASELQRAGRGGRPYVFLPQAFGPFTVPRVRRALRQALPSATLICARDETSLEHLRNLGADLGTRLVCYPDFTPLLKGDARAAEYYGVGDRTILIVPNCNMSGRRDSPSEWRERYVPLLEEMGTRCLQLGLDVRVLNHGGPSDRPICSQLTNSLRALPYIEEPDPIALKGVISCAGLVISSRFHACVSALSQAVPCIGTSWSHKYEALFKDYGASEMLLRTSSGEAAMSKLERSLEPGYRDGRAQSSERMEQLRLCEEMWDIAWDSIASQFEHLGRSLT